MYSISVVEHIPDDAAAISEMLRVTRPHGRVIVEVPYRQHAEDPDSSDGYKGKALDQPAFYERRYDAALLTENLTKSANPSVLIPGESLVLRSDFERRDPGSKSDPRAVVAAGAAGGVLEFRSRPQTAAVGVADL